MSKKIIYIAMFGAGVIVAIICGAKMPGAGDQFSDVLMGFCFGMIVAIIGNFLWHSEVRAEIKKMMVKDKDSDENPVFLLQRAVEQVQKLKEDFDKLDNQKVCDCIDEISEKFIHPFTEKRQTMMDMLGMEKGAEVLLSVAYGERMLNRVWSACSDGHRPEAISSLEQSSNNYLKAVQLVEY
jgi:hypothetical protein